MVRVNVGNEVLVQTSERKQQRCLVKDKRTNKEGKVEVRVEYLSVVRIGSQGASKWVTLDKIIRKFDTLSVHELQLAMDKAVAFLALNQNTLTPDERLRLSQADDLMRSVMVSLRNRNEA